MPFRRLVPPELVARRKHEVMLGIDLDDAKLSPSKVWLMDKAAHWTGNKSLLLASSLRESSCTCVAARRRMLGDSVSKVHTMCVEPKTRSAERSRSDMTFRANMGSSECVLFA